ncbi:MAG: hypothetical protein HFE76_14925 [Firmicutes bacterium]|nr:hypothetical protein [Bacillota bacterium]
MRREAFIKIYALSMALLLAVFFASCGEKSSDNDIMEEPEITVEYLTEEYAAQILRDGGKETLGSVELSGNTDEGYLLTIHSMVIVESSITEEGYYVADKNMSSSVPLDADARFTYIKSKKKGPEIVTLEEFVKLAQKDFQKQKVNGVKPSEEKLYQVYIIGGTGVMLLAKELPDV